MILERYKNIHYSEVINVIVMHLYRNNLCLIYRLAFIRVLSKQRGTFDANCESF